VIAARLAGQPAESTSRIYRIAELMRRYRPVLAGGEWRLIDREGGGLTTPTYDTEELAKAGANLMAACDIAALFEESEGR
jgi:hypothetical protein